MGSPINLYMPDGGERGVILAWFAGHGAHEWVEFRGRPYSKWGPEEGSPMAMIHDCMEGWHTTILHQDEVLTIHEKHPDYPAVRRMVDAA